MLRMVRLLARMTPRARPIGTPTHVVWGMATDALLMRRGRRLRQHHHVGVARATRLGLPFAEVVGPMAAHALRVPVGEKRGGRHERLLFEVTTRAGAQRIGRGRVLLLVARRAHLARGLSRQGVRRRDLLVAASAGSRLRLGVLVRSVAAGAFFGRVDLHAWRLALPREMTMRAVSRLVRVRRQWIPRRQRFDDSMRQGVGEAMAQGAFAGLVYGRMTNLRLFGVATRATLWPHRADGRFTQGVARTARHLLLHDVHVVTTYLSHPAPSSRNVHAKPVLRRRRAVPARARHEHGQQHRKRPPSPLWPSRLSGHGGAPCPKRQPTRTGSLPRCPTGDRRPWIR
jgi:hypothetical protein